MTIKVDLVRSRDDERRELLEAKMVRNSSWQYRAIVFVATLAGFCFCILPVIALGLKLIGVSVTASYSTLILSPVSWFFGVVQALTVVEDGK